MFLNKYITDSGIKDEGRKKADPPYPQKGHSLSSRVIVSDVDQFIF